MPGCARWWVHFHNPPRQVNMPKKVYASKKKWYGKKTSWKKKGKKEKKWAKKNYRETKVPSYNLPVMGGRSLNTGKLIFEQMKVGNLSGNTAAQVNYYRCNSIYDPDYQLAPSTYPAGYAYYSGAYAKYLVRRAKITVTFIPQASTVGQSPDAFLVGLRLTRKATAPNTLLQNLNVWKQDGLVKYKHFSVGGNMPMDPIVLTGSFDASRFWNTKTPDYETYGSEFGNNPAEICLWEILVCDVDGSTLTGSGTLPFNVAVRIEYYASFSEPLESPMAQITKSMSPADAAATLAKFHADRAREAASKGRMESNGGKSPEFGKDYAPRPDAPPKEPPVSPTKSVKDVSEKMLHVKLTRKKSVSRTPNAMAAAASAAAAAAAAALDDYVDTDEDATCGSQGMLVEA